MQHKAAIINLERTFFWILAAAAAALIAFYMYFVCASIVHVVARGQIEKEIGAVSSKIGELEAQYLTKKQAIDYRFALARGFVSAPAPQYLARADTGTRLTFNR